MAVLPSKTDPTLAAMAAEMEAQAKAELPRAYLGGSSIGDPCERKLWYRFRWAGKEHFGANTLANFEDGHASEAIMANRLRLVPGVQLVTHGDDGNQIGWKDLGGHFGMNCDGHILGVLQSPKTWHVWEHKATNPDKFKKLEKLKADYGEKAALKKWDGTYYAQAQVYMYYAGLTRHYLTCCTAGSREWTSVRTEADSGEAEDLIRKAERIICSDAAEQLNRVSSDPAYYLCRWCSFSGICHRGEPVQKNCRTCSKSEPTENGQWTCKKYKKEIPFDFQLKGCNGWHT